MKKKSNSIFYKIFSFVSLEMSLWWGMTAFVLSLLFFIFTLWVGTILWFQSIILSIFLVSGSYYFFYRSIDRHFKETAISGFDPSGWKSLMESAGLNSRLVLYNHPTPFIYSFDFFESQKIIISSKVNKILEEKERKILVQYLKFYFEYAGQTLTVLSYLIFFLFSPFYIVICLFQILKISFVEKFLTTLFRYTLLIPFLPYLRFKCYQLDSKIDPSLKKDYCDLIWKMQNHLDILPMKVPIFLSPLFLINPLTHPISWINIQPSSHRRIKKLIKNFPAH